MTEDGYTFFKIGDGDKTWTDGDMDLGTDEEVMDMAESGDMSFMFWYRLDSEGKEKLELFKENIKALDEL